MMKNIWGGSKPKNGSSTRVDTLIGRQIELHGDLSFSGGVHVDGKICGNVSATTDDSSAVLVLSRHGAIEGEIRVPHLLVNGLVVGDIYATDSIELAASARITGNVYYNRIEIAMGAEVNGSLLHMADAETSGDESKDKGEPPVVEAVSGQAADL